MPELPTTAPPPTVALSGSAGYPRRRDRDRGLIVAGIVAAILAVLALLAVVAINGERPLPTLGPSMKPTLAGRSSVNIDYRAYEHALPRRGEIVVVQAPDGYQGGCGVQARFATACSGTEGYSLDRLIKRIVAVPGDTIGFDSDGVVVRNGARQRETDIRRCGRLDCTLPTMRLGPDMYFLAGDNRPVSADSRLFGPIPLEAIDGRVSLIGSGEPGARS